MKRRKCWLPAFPTFSTMFSKVFFFMVVKALDCMIKSLIACNVDVVQNAHNVLSDP